MKGWSIVRAWLEKGPGSRPKVPPAVGDDIRDLEMI